MKKVLIILLSVIVLTVIKLLIPSKDINTQELYQYCKNNGYSSNRGDSRQCNCER